MKFSELNNERLCCDTDDTCDDSSVFDLELDDGDDDADTYQRRKESEGPSDFNEFIDELFDELVTEHVNELIDEDGITGAGYALLADLDAQGAFV
jgi:hypothetical protein